jgi:hypothetical protein
MAKYRKRPVVIEAVQYDGGNMPDGVCDGGQGCKSVGAPDGCVPHVHTLEGDMTVSVGDWIITGVKGERYPCKPDIFAMTYVPVGGLDVTADLQAEVIRLKTVAGNWERDFNEKAVAYATVYEELQNLKMAADDARGADR